MLRCYGQMQLVTPRRFEDIKAALRILDDDDGAWSGDSHSGHQLLLPPANWCPILAPWTTQGPAGCGGTRASRGRRCRPRPPGRC